MTTAIEPLDEFIEEQLACWPQSRALVAHVARTLIDAAFFGERGVERRRPVIAADGTPILLSIQENGRGQARPFRLLAEPGLPSLSVSEQIDFTLHTLNSVLGDLQWQSAGESVNAVVRTLFPSKADAVDSWWGGMGLGCALDLHGLELRLYCNVRENTVESRWRRVGAVLALFGSLAVIGDQLGVLMERVSQHAIPAGIALCIRDGYVRGLRLYVSLPNPDAQTICELGALDTDGRGGVVDVCNAYSEVRAFSYGCVTAALDFAISHDQTRIDLNPLRFKADFDCTPDPLRRCADRGAMTDWLARRHSACGLPDTGVRAFLDLLTRIFRGWNADYVSFGWRRGANEITTYVLPAGYATLHTASPT